LKGVREGAAIATSVGGLSAAHDTVDAAHPRASVNIARQSEFMVRLHRGEGWPGINGLDAGRRGKLQRKVQRCDMPGYWEEATGRMSCKGMA
jgi:hypothetical protein